MSIEAARAIVERMNSDQEFAERIGTCKSFDALQEIFTKEGMEVSEKELVEQLSALSDESLDQVAGGGIQHRHQSCNQVLQDIISNVLCVFGLSK